MYLYRTTLYHDTSKVLNPPANNDTDNTDFETNHKSSANAVNEVLVQETTFVSDLSYTDFKDKIDGVNVLWSDVKYIETNNAYVLHIVSDTEL